MNKMHVIGWKHSKGEFNNNAYNYVTLYVTTKMEQKENQRGMAGIDMRADSSILEAISKVDFSKGPVDMNLEIESRAIGKGQFVNTVVSAQPAIKI